MDSFDVLDTLPSTSSPLEIPSGCLHEESIQNDKHTSLCTSCGEVISKTISQERDWYFKSGSNPSRNQIRVVDDRSIYKDVENLKFSDHVVHIANTIYQGVTEQKVYRGNARRAIISACVFHAYKIIGEPQIYKNLIKTFNLNRKIGLKGLKHVSIHAPKGSPIYTNYITPRTFICYFMEKLQASEDTKTRVNELYTTIEDRSNKLMRSRPQSIAAGLVYYWTKSQGIDIPLKSFSHMSDLSELTILKIEKEIASIIDGERSLRSQPHHHHVS
jgi:transcription initiation factor TFIIIB Brf1 subunit/transcription initiation factor TFIIB